MHIKNFNVDNVNNNASDDKSFEYKTKNRQVQMQMEIYNRNDQYQL